MKTLFTLICLTTAAATYAGEGGDTTFVYNQHRIVVSSSPERTIVKVFTNNGTELRKTQETEFTEDSEVNRVYVSSPFFPTRKNHQPNHSPLPLFYIGMSTVGKHFGELSSPASYFVQDTKSNEWGLSLLAYRKHFSRTSPWGFVSGFQFGYVHHHFDTSYTLQQAGESMAIEPLGVENVKSSYLSYKYFRMPFLIEWGSQLGKRMPIGISFGPSLDYRFGDHVRYKVRGDGKHTVTNDARLHSFAVGADLHLHVGKITLMMHSSFTPLFKGATSPKAYPTSLTLGFNL